MTGVVEVVEVAREFGLGRRVGNEVQEVEERTGEQEAICRIKNGAEQDSRFHILKSLKKKKKLVRVGKRRLETELKRGQGGTSRRAEQYGPPAPVRTRKGE